MIPSYETTKCITAHHLHYFLSWLLKNFTIAEIFPRLSVLVSAGVELISTTLMHSSIWSIFSRDYCDIVSIRMWISLPKRFRCAWVACAWTSPCPGSHKSLLQCLLSMNIHLGTTQNLFTAQKMLPLSSDAFGIRDFLSACVILWIFSIIQKTLLLPVTPGWGL